MEETGPSMPAPYPFIDVAVHDSIRPRFARGEALVVFSPALDRVLWANGAGARFFGNASIYDFLEEGPSRSDVTFRQIEAAARQLGAVGDSRTLVLRVASGFQRVPVNAVAEMVEIRAGEPVVLLSVPPLGKPGSLTERAADMLTGFDDPDTHMAVLDGAGQVVVASERFGALGITPQTARTLVTLAGADADHLVKRPIPTGRGHLPAAIGKLCDEPALHLLFAVETILGHMDPTEPFEAQAPEAPAPALDRAAEDAPMGLPATAPVVAAGVHDAEQDFAAVVDAIGAIEEFDGDDVEPLGEAEDAATGMDAAPGEDDGADSALALADAAEQVAAHFAEEHAPRADEGTGAAAADLFEAAPDEARAPAPEHEAALPSEQTADDAEAVTAEASHVPEVPETPETAAPSADRAPQAAPAAALPDAAAPTPAAGSFVFSPERRATRFVWKIDAEGRFCDVSGEFAEAVGPKAAAINGVAFTELAERFNLDPDGKIAELLKKRDTWSGKTILWPVEGTRLLVPVDLAALPTYTRTRDFDGFRGFGIVRLADAVTDPNGIGLTFAAAPAPAEADAAAETEHAEARDEDRAESPDAAFAGQHAADAVETAPPVADATGDETALEAGGTDEASADEVDSAAAGPALPHDTFEEATEDTAAFDDERADEEAGAPTDDAPADAPTLFEPAAPARPVPASEPPALQIVPNPGRRHSDKVVQLEERRARGKDGLTPGEQAAFLEIARKLDPQGLREKAAEALNEIRRNELARTTAADEDTEADADSDRESVGESAEDAAATAPLAETASPDETASAPGAAAGDAAPRPAVADASAPFETPAVSDEAALREFATLRLKRDNALSAEIVDLMPVALLIHVGDRLIHANPEFLSLTGYASLDDLDTAGGLDVLIQRQDLEGASEEAGRVVIVRADDQLVPVTARLQSVRFERATALMLALVPAGGSAQAPADKPLAPAADIAAPVAEPASPAAAEQLARLQVEVDELRAILETATDGVVILGADGDIRSMNRAASALFNFDEAETRGKPFVMLFAHESQKSILDYLGGLSGHGVASVLNDGREVIGREASGGFLPLFMTIGKLTSSNGYCAVIRDITQWKRTEEELRNAKRAAETANAHKSDFLARVSHEIRTPLNAIIGFADMMANEHFGPLGHPRYGEYANDIVRSGRHVLDIVNDLLDISKIEAGEMDLDFTAVGLNETVQAAVSIVQPQANGQRVIIRTALSQAVPNVVADMRSIKQIVLNILANAIRFTPSGGQIIVSTAYEANGSVVLRVRDTGIGMTRTELEQAMKPFRQVHAGPRNRGDGTGLGLPLTKAMVDANRATFAISSAPNEGTLVEITFPSQRVLAD